MKNINLKNILFLLFFITIIPIIPKLIDGRVIHGQFSKQTYVSEMAKSFANGETIGIFPIRHFMEPYHSEPVAWAEEVPAFTLIMAGLHKITGIPIPIGGRLLSFSFFLLLLAGAWKLGREYTFFSFLVFPVFRLYGFSIMPDLAMTALCLWAIVFAREEKWFYSAIAIGIASLFKYYAYFTGLALILYALSTQKSWKILLQYILCLLPTAFYIAYFLAKGIPNPIQEYRDVGGTGHMGGLSNFLLQKSYYKHLLTWHFTKNASLPGTALFLIGLFAIKKIRSFPTSLPHDTKLILSLLLANILFMILFAPSFYVHDYYGIQFAILTAWVAAIGLHWIWSKQKIVASTIAIACIIVAQILITNASGPVTCYDWAAKILRENTQKEEWGIWIMDRYGESSLHMADRTAWMVSSKAWLDWPGNPNIQKAMSERIYDSRVKWIGLIFTEQNMAGFFELYRPVLAKAGWKKIAFSQEMPLSSRNDLPAAMWILRKQ